MYYLRFILKKIGLVSIQFKIEKESARFFKINSILMLLGFFYIKHSFFFKISAWATWIYETARNTTRRVSNKHAHL